MFYVMFYMVLSDILVLFLHLAILLVHFDCFCTNLHIVLLPRHDIKSVTLVFSLPAVTGSNVMPSRQWTLTGGMLDTGLLSIL